MELVGHQLRMVHYKLNYFPLRARAELARQIFAVARVEFEDVAVPIEKRPTSGLKEKCPFGQVPVLEVDGKRVLGQSIAIARFLAKTFGIAGKTSWEEARVDSLADVFRDYLDTVQPFLSAFVGFRPGDVALLREELFVPNFRKFFGFFEKILVESKSGFLVGDSLTWVDLLIAQHIDDLLREDLVVPEGIEHVLEHQKRVHDVEQIKNWVNNRPAYPF